ncbi:MAG: hypothetical protein K2Q22_16385 [Cytophagales bacterium]|nr:hypothetical protein [Cytophagales bacterium]
MNLTRFFKVVVLSAFPLVFLGSCSKSPELVYPTVSAGSQTTVNTVLVATVEGKNWYVPSESLSASFNSTDSIVTVTGNVSDISLTLSFYAKEANKNLIDATASYSGATYLLVPNYFTSFSLTTPIAYIGKGAAGKFTLTLFNAANANTVTFSSGSFLVKY